MRSRPLAARVIFIIGDSVVRKAINDTFKGESAHAAGGPWRGRSALDAVELMNAGWNFRREHLRTQQRSHYVITNGGDQPNVVPPIASVWYYFRELDYDRIMEMRKIGDSIAQGAAMMTNTTVTSRILGAAWPLSLALHVVKILKLRRHRTSHAEN